MTLKVSPNFSYKIKGSEIFSAAKEDWLFIESTDLVNDAEKKPPLSISQHCGLIQRLCGDCMWLVESPSMQAAAVLRKYFPGHTIRGLTIGGYMEPDLRSIELFWSLFTELDRKEPWNQEQPWGIAGIKKRTPDPDFWTVEDVLRNPNNVESLFVQAGWFACLGAKRTDKALNEIAQEFPVLF